MTAQEPPESTRRLRWVAPAARWLLALVAVGSLAVLALEGATLAREAENQTCLAYVDTAAAILRPQVEWALADGDGLKPVTKMSDGLIKEAGKCD